METARLYIDGYNFYYAIKNSSSHHISNGWCDFRKLAENELLDSQTAVEKLKYFTARVEDFAGDGERQRQALWLQAVQTSPGIEVFYGLHMRDGRRRKEKMTDVNIAIELVLDGQAGLYDRALLITGDVDLAPAARAVVKRFDRPVDVWIPPGVRSQAWAAFAEEHHIGCKELKPFMLRRHRLPDRIETANGVIESLQDWRLPERPDED